MPTINIGNRQLNRASSSKIINIPSEKLKIVETISMAKKHSAEKSNSFGKGNSSQLFLDSLESLNIWEINHQKQFKDAY